jgi:large subunit ribosomal protein L9
MPATESNLRTLEHRRSKIAERKAQDVEVAEQIKAKIDSQSITFEAKSGEGGRLFGSITSQDIADAIHEHFGVFVDKRKISEGTPIKNVGVHPITIKIHSAVAATVRILVGTPEEIAAAEEAARLAAERAAARAAAEAEAAARAEEEAAAAAAAADAESDAPDYDEYDWSMDRGDSREDSKNEAAEEVPVDEAPAPAEEVAAEEVPAEETTAEEDAPAVDSADAEEASEED